MERERQPYIGHRANFHEVYPSVHSAIAHYIEYDFAGKPYESRYDLADGPKMNCRNPRCVGGGYRFEAILQEMLPKGETEREFEICCLGEEGSPKGKRKRAPSCDRRVEGVLKVAYKAVQPAQPENTQESSS